MKESRFKTLVFASPILIIFLILVVIKTCTPPPIESRDIVLQREWTANAEYAGDIWASKIAKDAGINLVVKEGSELLDPVHLVRSRDVHFGVASADRILQENEGGAELVIIASATYKTPVVFLSKKGKGIIKPQDFVGKKVGIQAGTNTELVLHGLLNSTNIDEGQIRIVESGWGIQTFLTDDIDVLGAFDYDETIQLDMQGVEYNKILPEDYGVKYVGTVYFTSKDLVREDPVFVQIFLNYLTLGWKKALSETNESIDMLSAFNSDVNHEKERESLKKGAEYFKGENDMLLYSSKDRWSAMTDSLIAIGRIEEFDYEKNIDYSFLEIALSNMKEQ